MPVAVKVRHNRQIIVPVRFTRAVTGPPVIDAPDIDDRGFVMGARSGTWGQSKARGPMVGITEGDTIRLKVVREDIDDTTPLFITSTNPKSVEVVSPAPGERLPIDGIFRIRGVKDFANVPVAVQVRLGNENGPVIGEIEPHVFQLRTLRVRIHFTTINGVRTARTEAGLRQTFEEVNAIFRPNGIEFRIDEFVETAVNGFATAGTVTTNLNPAPTTPPTPASWDEFSRLINTNFSRTKINLYCVVDNNGEWLGLTFDNDVRRPAPGRAPTFEGYGIAVIDSGRNNTFAHELGHYLDLNDHYNTLPGGVRREDMWCRRCLMSTPHHWGDPTAETPPQPAFRHDIGYGTGLRGGLMTLKNLPCDPRDDEVARTRRRALNPY
jgi:hypothetical protein